MPAETLSAGLVVLWEDTMRGLVRAALPGALLIAAVTAVTIGALADAGNGGGYDGMLHAPTVATSSVPTVTAPSTPTIVAPQPYCDIDFCTVPDTRGTGEWVVYLAAPEQLAMSHQAYPTDAVQRNAS